MRELGLLFWTQLNVNVGFSALRYRFRRERDKIPQTLAIGVTVAVLVAGLVAAYTLLMVSVYSAGGLIGHPEIALEAAILGVQLFLLVTGIFYVLGVFFYSRDLSALIPLPVKPWQVLGSKFLVVLFYEYLMALPVLVPPVVIYGVGEGAGPFYWIKAIVVVAASPAIPLLVSSLFALALMRFLNVGRRKDILATAGGFAAVLIVVAVNLLAQRVAGRAAQDPQALMKLLASQTGLVNSAGSAFPPSAWATLALSGNGASSWLYLLLFVALSAVLAAAMLGLAGRLYYAAAAKSEEVSRRKPGSAGSLERLSGAGPVRALFTRELKLLVRTPAFLMNCLGASLIVPVLIPLSIAESGKATSGIIALVRDSHNSLAVTFTTVGVMLFVAVVNVTASTAFSREGKAFWMSRMIPTPPRLQVRAKFLSSMAVSGAGILLCDVLSAALMRLPAFNAAVALPLGLLAAVPVTCVSMLPDLLKPKLTWTNPYEAVKQNLNVLTAMLGSVVLVGLEVLFVVLLARAGLPDWAVYLASAALLAALSAAGLRLLAAASEHYYKIEV